MSADHSMSARGQSMAPPPRPFDRLEFDNAMRRLPDRIAAKIDFAPDTSCWHWTGAAMASGYANCWTGDKVMRAAKYVYEELFFDVAEGRDLSPLCRNKRCVNPSHMQPVSRSTALARGLSGENLAAFNRARTTCPKGHAYDEQNTSIRGGSRRCKACDQARSARRRVARAQLALVA